MIKWGSSSFRPSNGQGQGINPPKRQNILTPLESRSPQGLVWGSQIVNVQKDGSTPTPPFDPMSIAGLQIWLDADDESTLNTYTSGSEVIVSGWTSKGNWTGTLSAETETRAPRFITNGGEGSSKAVFLYSGASSANNSGLFYRSNDKVFDLNSGVTIFIFSKTRQIRTNIQGWTGSQNLNMGMFTGGTSTSFGQSTVQMSNTGLNVSNQTGATAGYSWANGGIFPPPSYRNITPYFLRASSLGSTSNNLNGVGSNLIGTKDTSFTLNREGAFSQWKPRTINQIGLNTTRTTGTTTYGTSFSNPNEFYEMLVYDRELTESEYNQVRQYLLDKWDYTVTIPSGYTEVDVIYSNKGFTGNTQFSQYWYLENTVEGSNWFKFTNEFSGVSKAYWPDENTNISFQYPASEGTINYYANFDIYGNGVLFDRLLNVRSQDATSSDNIVNIPKPITVSGYTSWDIIPTTIYINFTGTSATGVLSLYSGNSNAGNLIYTVGGIQTVNTGITYEYIFNSTFYVEYSDSESKGNYTPSFYLNNCDQNDIKELLTSGSGDNWNYELQGLNPRYCLMLNSEGNP